MAEVLKLASLPGSIFTVGLSSDKQREFELQFDDPRLEHIGKELLEAIVRYLHTSKRYITDGEKMGWATSVISFDLHNDRLQLKAFQLKEDQFSSHADALLRD